MDMGYLRATDEDVMPIFDLCKSLIETYEDLSSIDYPKVLAWVEKKLRANIENYTAITLAGETVGYYCLEKQGDKWELDDFYILPGFRGKGVGTAVLNFICRNTDGCIFLYVFRKNIGAISLYERFGFETVKLVSDTRQIMERPG